MSVIAKILVVLNLILAVVFLGTSSTYLGQKESWKIQYVNLDTKLNEEIKNLKASLASADTNLKEQRTLAEGAQKENAELKKGLDERQTAHAELVTAHAKLLAQYEQMVQNANGQKDTIAALKTAEEKALADREAAITEKQQAMDEKNKAVTEQQRLQAEVDAGTEMQATLQKQLVETTDELNSTKLIVKAYEDKVGVLAGITSVPTIKAMVSGVDNNLNIVMLSVGRDEKVRVGFEFTIYRGTEYVGKVVINRVERDYCSGESKKEIQKSPIQVGDQATTRF